MVVKVMTTTAEAGFCAVYGRRACGGHLGGERVLAIRLVDANHVPCTTVAIRGSRGAGRIRIEATI
jgi:hypothetical protein